MGGAVLILLYILIAAVPMIVASFLAVTHENAVYELGRNFALIGFMVLILQVFPASRLKWIERPFGLDIVLRFHRNMGIFALLLLLAHPLLLSAGLGSAGLLIGIKVPWYIWLGRLTLVLLLANVLLSTYQTSLKFRFEKWRAVHDILSPLILVFAFVHSFTAGQDLRNPFLQGVWAAALLAAVVLFVYHRIVRPMILKSHPYRVIEVRPEASDVWTIKLAPPEGRKIEEYLPGQFHFITFYRDRSLPVEEHHWTISSPPSQGEYVSSTIKALGDFTSTMGETKTGDVAAVHGAFGRFSYLFHPEERDLVFVAGGIGITPLMSMIRYMHDVRDARNVVLFYGNQKEDQIVFRDELSNIESEGYPSLKVVHVISSPEKEWTGETGYVDREKIRKHCGDNLQGKAFYLCGPAGMLEAVASALKGMGVADRQIRTEIFSFLD
jgi:predicted ferric reductase